MSEHKLTKDDIKKVTKEEPVANKKKVNVPMLVIHIIEILIAAAYITILAFGRIFLPAGNEFFMSFDLFSGVDPLHPARLLSYALFSTIVATVLRIILKLLSKNKAITKKLSVAVMQLLRSLVKVVLIIIILCLALNAIGVDATAILAGLGILTLIIGLGITSLIEDVMAGVFIIAERLFDVGDIIVINGFRGSVVSIGVRSTKLADVGGDILTLRNSSIGSLINLTDRQSCAALTLPIAPEESLAHVEQVIKEAHIENIRSTCDKMLADPLYLGLCEITPKGVQMLLFIAGCKEDDRYDVERALYHGLKTIFDENGIKLGNPGVIIDDQK
ncbi:MAG: mechanosensitive ion channel [Bacilli bacterium]|nr:mechanosensitive ion channel [Bacilli bacterium]